MARKHAEIEEQIIAALDIADEYRSLGVKLTTNTPSTDGWIYCHSFGREDGDASAEINVRSGRYHDFKSGDDCSLWEFAATKAGRHADWKAAREYYANKAGIDLPSSKSKASDESSEPKARGPEAHLEWMPWNDELVQLWCWTKPPISVESVKANGGRLAMYYGRYPVVALPIYPDGRLGNPCGWVVWHTGGQSLPVFNGQGNVTAWKKMKMTAGSERGYIGQWALERIGKADRVWKVEGPGDVLAGWTATPPDLRETHLFVTNSSGCGEHPGGPAIATLFAGKRCGIVHDCDIPGQDGAIGSTERNKLGWAGSIARVAGEARNVVLPFPIVEKKGKDLRDYFCEGKSYGQLVALYEMAPVTEATPITSLEGPDDPHRLARLFLQSVHGTRQGEPVLKYWLDEFFRWRDGSYRRIRLNELTSNVAACCKEEFDRLNLVEQSESKDVTETRKVTRRLLGDVMLALQGMCTMTHDDRQPPFWIGAAGPWPAREVFATENCLVHLPSLVDPLVEDATLPATPLYFTTNGTDYAFHAKAPRPERWLSFLESIWPDDPESIRLLQQWFGYCLLPDTSQQKMLFLVGAKRSGKGTIARILEALVGSRNVSSPTLTGLGTQFGLWGLLGSTLAIIGEARISQRFDTAQVVENLLSLSGEDSKDIDRKGLEPLRGVKLNTRFVIISNEDPDLRDASGTIISRMLVLKLTNSFYKRENKRLTEQLLKELPGILLWAAEGYRDLQEVGSFAEPESSKNAIREMERTVSPIRAFIDDCLIVKPGHSAPCSAVYEAWRTWSKEEDGRDRCGSTSNFSRQLRAALPIVDTQRPGGTGRRERIFTGIAVKAEANVGIT